MKTIVKFLIVAILATIASACAPLVERTQTGGGSAIQPRVAGLFGAVQSIVRLENNHPECTVQAVVPDVRQGRRTFTTVLLRPNKFYDVPLIHSDTSSISRTYTISVTPLAVLPSGVVLNNFKPCVGQARPVTYTVSGSYPYALSPILATDTISGLCPREKYKDGWCQP